MTKDIYQQMTDRIMLTGSKIIPELFRMIAHESEAELMMAMPGTPETLAEKTGRPVDEVEQAIDAGNQQILDIDSANRIINNADIIAVTKCTCRITAHKCDMPLEVCPQVGNAAKYTLDRGTGRALSKEEALAVLADCEEKGLVHVTMNKAYAGHFICNCCSCCCQAMPLVISEGLNILDPSRYVARIDPGRCSACGIRVDRCFFSAIEEDGDTMAVIAEKCMGCGLCQVTCPEDAITLNAVRQEDFIPV